MTDYGGPRSPASPGRYIASAIRDEVIERDRGTCRYCGMADSTDLDHIIPWAQGGSHDPGNLVCCCGVCNSIAGLRVFPFGFPQKLDYVRMRRDELGYNRLRMAYFRVARGLRASIE